MTKNMKSTHFCVLIVTICWICNILGPCNGQRPLSANATMTATTIRPSLRGAGGGTGTLSGSNASSGSVSNTNNIGNSVFAVGGINATAGGILPSAASGSGTPSTGGGGGPETYYINRLNRKPDSQSLLSSGVAVDSPFIPQKYSSTAYQAQRGRKHTFTDLRKTISDQKNVWNRQGDEPETNEDNKNPMWVLKQKFKNDVSTFISTYMRLIKLEWQICVGVRLYANLLLYICCL